MNAALELKQPQTVASTCCYCGVGCGVLIDSDGTQVLKVSGDPKHPANSGKLCSKGSALHLSAQGLEQRLLYPELRTQRANVRTRSDWPATFDYLASRFARIIREHGPDAVAFYVSGQMLTEDYYVFNKLAKGLVGTNNIDTNSRLCMSSAVSGYKLALGADSVPTCYDDIDCADVMLISGSNMAWAHPVLFRRIEAAKQRNPDLAIIVIDPRRTDTAAMADIHLPITPGTDIALFNSILHVLIRDGLLDDNFIHQHTDHFDGVALVAESYAPEKIAAQCGIASEDIVRVAHRFGTRGSRALSFYCMGLNQSAHGSANNAALINLHLATGKIGRPGCGPFSLTGQPNAMGGREVGGMANLLSAHRDLANPQHREEVAQLWGIDSVPEKPGKTAVAMFDAVRRGEIKAIWIACTNPVHSMPNQRAVVEALQRAELVVVQECFRNTDTLPYADVVLPATTWAEKEGTVTNSERRISHVRAATGAPGEARHDWRIATEFARVLATQLGKSPDLFPYETPEQVFDEHKRTTAGRDLDITGLSYALLDARGPQQWPFTLGAPGGKKRLYEDGSFATPNRRAQFYAAQHQGLADDIDAEFPLRLTSGRLRDQWHNMSRTGRVSRLHAHSEEPWLDMHAGDMRLRNLTSGDVVEVRSRRGALRLRVREDATPKSGLVYLPMHWSAQVMSGAGVNVLTTDAVDPLSFQPELKHAAVQVTKLVLPWRMAVIMYGDVLRVREQLQPLLSRFAYANLVQFGRGHEGVMMQAWDHALPDGVDVVALEQLVGLDPTKAMHYRDDARGIRKTLLVENNRVRHLCFVGETRAIPWLRELVQEQRAVDGLRPWLLAPLAEPPLALPTRGKILCTCKDVSENEIRAAIASGAGFDQLKANLKCGTGCGSCVPEIKRMLA